MTPIEMVEKALRLEEARLEALLELNQMTGRPLQEITDFALEEAVRLTESEIGYLAFMNQDETILTMHSWSKSAMNQCEIVNKPKIYPVITTGLWGEAVRQRRPVSGISPRRRRRTPPIDSETPSRRSNSANSLRDPPSVR